MLDNNLSYINGGNISENDMPYMMIHQYFKRLCISSDGNSGITFYNSEGRKSHSTFKEIAAVSSARLDELKGYGLRPKDMLILQCSTGRDFIEMFWACMFGGIVPIPLNHIYDTDHSSQEAVMLKNIMKMTNDPMVAVSADSYDDYANMFGNLEIDRERLYKIGEVKGLREFSDDMIPDDTGISPDDLAIMFFTSGSTGVPKGVMQSNRAMVSREIGVAKLNGFHKDTALNWMPLEHAGGVLMAHFRSVYLMSEQIIVDKEYILQDPLRWLDLMSEHKVVYSWAPHFAFELINKEIESRDDRNWDLTSVEFLLNGGEMINCKGAKKFLKLLKLYGLRDTAIHPSWGMCETCSGVLYNNDLDSSEKSGIQTIKNSPGINIEFSEPNDSDSRSIMSIGQPIPGIEIRITDDHDKILEVDTIGRFQIKGTPVTSGYYKNDEVNRESFTDDGWFITGDLGFIHNGEMILTGREKDTIIINGLNYNNSEIEAIIESLPFIEKSFTAVCAVSRDNDDKDSVAAFFTVKDDTDPYFARKKVKEIVKSKMHLSIDEAIMVSKEEIPKSNLEKIQRKKLSAMFNNGYFDSVIGKIREYEALERKFKPLDWFFAQRFVKAPFDSADAAIKKMCIIGDIPQSAADTLAETADNAEFYTDITAAEGVSCEKMIFRGDFSGVRYFCKMLASGKIKADRVYVITKKLCRVDGNDVCTSDDAPIIGLLKCLDAELEDTVICNIDVEDIEKDKDNIANEIRLQTSELRIAYRKNTRYADRLVYPKNNNDGRGFGYRQFFVVTGGLGGIGTELAKFLLKYYDARVLLLGRSDISQNNEKYAKFEMLRDISENVYYEAIDISQENGLEKIIDEYEQKTDQSVSVIIHTAGLGELKEHWEHSEERMIKNCPDELYNEMFKAKITGTNNLYSVISKRENARLILCGSTNSYFGSATFAAYSAANSYVDSFANQINNPQKIICLNFSTWKGLGMSQNNNFGSIGAKKGFYEMETNSGLLSIVKAQQFDENSVFVGLDSSKEFIASYLSEDIRGEHIAGSENRDTEMRELNENEMKLADIWKRLLSCNEVVLSDDFFELGGNSLRAIKLNAEIKEAYNIDYSLKQIFQFSTFDEMIKNIEDTLRR